MDVRTRNIEVHIDELILSGVRTVDRATVARAIERELSRLMAHSGLPPSWNESYYRPTIDGSTFTLAPTDSADSIGARVAEAVNQGLSQ